MTMEELVQQLVELQGELAATMVEATADERVVRLRATVDDAAKRLDAAKIELSNEMIYYEATYERFDMDIDYIKAQIIETWDGEKKTLQGDGWVLKFRTTESLKIENETLVLTGLLDHTSVKDVAANYITGFNKTAVKKYMGVLALPQGAAEIEQKTTVKLVVEG